MDAFGDNFVIEPEADPVADFMSRQQDDLAELEAEIPAVNIPPATTTVNTDVGPGGDAEGSFEIIYAVGQPTEPQPPPAAAEATPAAAPPVKEEPEKIWKWREEQKTRLEEKDAEEEKKKEEWREAARKELEEWYKHHAEAISKTKTTNRNAEKQFVAEADEVEPGTEWERIAKLCDFNPKSSRTSKDVSRMRSIILQLKQTPPAPLSV